MDIPRGLWMASEDLIGFSNLLPANWNAIIEAVIKKYLGVWYTASQFKVFTLNMPKSRWNIAIKRKTV